jgi:hypothetical protein
MKNIVEVYCFVDNFVKLIESKSTKNPAGRKSMLTKTDCITLAILKQDLGIKTTKQLYEFVQEYMKKDFPILPSYQQFNHGIKSTFRYFAMIAWILTKMTRQKGSRYHIVDSSPLPVCNNQYRLMAKLFKGLARPGKNLNGWFWGFKLHLIINHDMEIESIKISDGSTRDLDVLEGDFIEKIGGWLVGDKGYIGKEKVKELASKGIRLVTKSRKNMKKFPTTPIQNYLFSKRQSIESVFSYLKHRLSAVNCYARSVEGFFVNVFSAIVTYTLNRTKQKNLYLQEFSMSLIS